MARASLPAPDRSFASAQSSKIAADCFENSKILVVAEAHDMSNDKYLADNPAYFDALKANGGKYVFAELPIAINGLVNDFVAGNVTKSELMEEYKKFGYTSRYGDSLQESAKQISGLCDAVKNSGVKIFASDFRFLKDKAISSDAFGVPDIQDRDDMVKKVTMAALKDLKEYNGHGHVMNHSDYEAFIELHSSAVSSLSDADRAKLDADIAKRTDIATTDFDAENRNAGYQNKLQFDLFQRFVDPGDAAMFFGGKDHFKGSHDMSDLMQRSGYGYPTKVMLLSDAGMFANKFILAAGGEGFSEGFKYTVNAETGRLVGENGELLPENGEKPAVTAPEQEKSFFKLPSLIDKVFN